MERSRRLYGRIAPDSVVDFLMLDCEFPRSVHYCIIAAQQSLHAVSGTPMGTFRNPAEQQLGRLRSELDYADKHHIIEGGLHETLDLLQKKINLIGDAIFDTFFALQPAQQQRSGDLAASV